MFLKKDNNKIKVEWYNNPNIITNLLIYLIIFIIILSQSFAINSSVGGFKMFSNILNHNIIYMIVFGYFIFLKTKTGKKYFNYTNLILIFLYFVTFISSLLTVFQSFSLSTMLVLAIQAVLFIYLFHTMLRKTSVWKEFRLDNSPFLELSNSWYFGTVVILEVTLLAVEFITITNFDGVVLSLLDCLYIILFARYIYLYREFLNIEEGSIDDLKDTVNVAMKKIEEVYKESEIDKKIDEVSEKITDGIDSVVKKAEEIYEKADIDEKVEKVSKKAAEVYKDIKEKIDNDSIEKSEKNKKSVENKSSKKGGK